MDDHQVNTIPNHHSTKMDVLQKTFFQIIPAAKWFERHSIPSPIQQRRHLPTLTSLFFFYVPNPQLSHWKVGQIHTYCTWAHSSYSNCRWLYPFFLSVVCSSVLNGENMFRVDAKIEKGDRGQNMRSTLKMWCMRSSAYAFSIRFIKHVAWQLLWNFTAA